MARKRKKRSKLKMSFIKTRLVKKDVPADLVPLFNHIIRLARSDEASGVDYRKRRAGIDLRKARRLAKK